MAGVRIIGAIAIAACLLAVVSFVLVVIAWAKPEVITDDHDHDKEQLQHTSGTTTAGTTTTGTTSAATTDCPGQARGHGEKDVYLFAVGTDWIPYEYINAEGDLVGFGLDIMRDVCHEMNKQCEYYAMFDYAQCVDDETMNSEGLWNNWFDACLSYVPTPSRLLTFSTLAPYFKASKAYFYVLSSSRIDDLSEVDFSSNEFGFLTSWYINAVCVQKQMNKTIPSQNIMVREDMASLMNDLRASRIDIIVVDEYEAEDVGVTLRVIGEGFNCATAGGSIITRKGNTHALQWFEEGLQRIMDNGRYAALCDMAINYQGGDRLTCIE